MKRLVMEHVRRFPAPSSSRIQRQQHRNAGLIFEIQQRNSKKNNNRACFSTISDVGKISILVDPKKENAKTKRRKEKNAAKNPKSNKSNMQSYQFIDRSRLRVQGGMGGSGSLSTKMIRRKAMLKPDGGNGGDGGSVIIVADASQQTLTRSHPHVAASKGTNGTSQECHGGRGDNRIIRVPAGVIVKRVLEHDDVWDEETKTVIRPVMEEEEEEADPEAGTRREDYERSYFEMIDSLHEEDDQLSDEDEDDHEPEKKRRVVVLADLDEPGTHVVVARGGRGGLGTAKFGHRHGPMPNGRALAKRATPEQGELAFLELELKSIADLGLVGFPNAGKSSLLRAMSKAAPEVAPYPFTTLHPLVGFINYRDGFRVAAADIPGLIDGASSGRGKGHDFLRHVERTKALMYIVDAARVDYRDPIEDLNILAKELGSYGDGSLMERRALVVANKVDLLHEDQTAELLVTLHDAATELGIQFEHEVMGISAGVTGEGLGVLSKAIRDVVTSSEEDRQLEFERSQELYDSGKVMQSF